MSDEAVPEPVVQGDLFETEAARSLLDQLLSDSRLYTKSQDYKDLLDFVIRLRNFAPFNAMLLHVQKPGLTYAASAHDWHERFQRAPKEGARPLLILWPFGPVALVYDVLDTEGKDLPKGVSPFYAHGPINQERIGSFISFISRKGIEVRMIDAGEGTAGSIRVIQRAASAKQTTLYKMLLNRNHEPAVQFTTIAHELGHLFLGHLGPDRALAVPERASMDHRQVELEAESVAYLLCARNKVISKSEAYLSRYVTENTSVDHVDVYQVMRAAGQVEALLGLTAHTKYDGGKSRQFQSAAQTVEQQGSVKP
jgi:IrrE N-terminal-like domain